MSALEIILTVGTILNTVLDLIIVIAIVIACIAITKFFKKGSAAIDDIKEIIENLKTPAKWSSIIFKSKKKSKK